MTTPDDLKTTDPVRATLAEHFEEADFAVLYRIIPESGTTTTQEIANVSADDCQSVAAALRTPAPLHSGEPVALLKEVREEIVIAISFLGRDAYSPRLSGTVDGLIKRLAATDKKILALLDSSTSPPAIELDGGPVAEGRCDVTLTERFTNPNCRCKTYAGNKGPCQRFEAGQNGNCVYCDHERACHIALAVPKPERAGARRVRWQRVNDELFEYAIQQGPHGDEFVKLPDGTCLRRALSPVALHDGGE